MNLWTFRKMPLIALIFSKNAKKCFMDSGKSFPVSNFLKSVTSSYCSNDTKEADILDHCGLPLDGD